MPLADPARTATINPRQGSALTSASHKAGRRRVWRRAGHSQETRGSSATPSPLPGAAAVKLNYSAALLIGCPSPQRQQSGLKGVKSENQLINLRLSFCSSVKQKSAASGRFLVTCSDR